MTLFQELVLISLGKRDRFSRRLTEADWALLYKEAQRQSLVGVLLTGVEKVVALGGVTLQNIPQVKDFGFGGVAVLGDVWQRVGDADVDDYLDSLRMAL